MGKAESQNIEWKSTWRDEYFKHVCGFANADGGSIYIGVDDKGKVIGLENYQKLLEDLPNKVRDILGIICEVNLRTKTNKYFIEIKVEPYSTPISYHGHFYYRSGSTIQDMNGPALEKFLLGKSGKKWDSIIAPDFSFKDLSHDAFGIFRNKALRSKRIPEHDINESDKNLAKYLGLFSGTKLKRAAVIAFGDNPERLVTGAYVKIGFFRTDTDLLYQDEIHGSLFVQIEKTMDLLLTKYMRANIAYEGLTRTETYEYPEDALREALLNSLIHKDYSSGNPIQISVYKDWMMIWNAGDLPKGWTKATLKKKHTSEPANPDIAGIFFRAGYIESWGRGTLNIVQYCKDAGIPDPEFEDKWGGLAVIFRAKKETLVANNKDGGQKRWSEKVVRKSGQKITLKQLELLSIIQNESSISRKRISEILKINESAVQKRIKSLVDKGIIKRVGPDKGGHWEIINEESSQEE